ncbi:MAG TPA: hypothetical protein VM186_05480 [Planctomycetota bacterium]|nr:hypothetical protein [Planctomycetota bacterium]
MIAGKKIALPAADLPSPPFPLSKLGEGVGVRMEFKALEMKVLAFLPAELGDGKLTLQAAPAPGGEVRVRWQAADANGRPMAAAVPLSVAFKGPGGSARGPYARATGRDGVWAETFTLGANERAGKWTVTVKELLSGRTRDLAFDLPAAAQAIPQAIQPMGDVAVYQEQHVRDLLATEVGKPVTVIVSQPEYRQMAEQIAWELRKERGYRVAVRYATEVPQRRYERWLGYGTAHYPLGVPAARPEWVVDSHVILVGEPASHPLIWQFMADTSRPTRLVTADFPGSGKGLIDLIWYGLNDEDYQTILVTGTDRGGVELAVDRLTDMIRAR